MFKHFTSIGHTEGGATTKHKSKICVRTNSVGLHTSSVYCDLLDYFMPDSLKDYPFSPSVFLNGFMLPAIKSAACSHVFCSGVTVYSTLSTQKPKYVLKAFLPLVLTIVILSSWKPSAHFIQQKSPGHMWLHLPLHSPPPPLSR